MYTKSRSRVACVVFESSLVLSRAGRACVRGARTARDGPGSFGSTLLRICRAVAPTPEEAARRRQPAVAARGARTARGERHSFGSRMRRTCRVVGSTLAATAAAAAPAAAAGAVAQALARAEPGASPQAAPRHVMRHRRLHRGRCCCLRHPHALAAAGLAQDSPRPRRWRSRGRQSCQLAASTCRRRHRSSLRRPRPPRERACEADD